MNNKYILLSALACSLCGLLWVPETRAGGTNDFVSDAVQWPDPAYIDLLVRSNEPTPVYGEERAMQHLVNAIAHVDDNGQPQRYTQRQYEDDLGKLFREQGMTRLSGL